MHILSRAIEPSPEIFLQEMTWIYGTNDGNAAGAPKQAGYVVGEIRPFQGDYRAAIETINGVARRLARDPAVAEVRVVKYPLNVNPGLALSGNTRDTPEQSGVADFKITLSLKPDA